ncbi:MAG: hypothetical protein RSD04_01345 [Clostridia bacterium]
MMINIHNNILSVNVNQLGGTLTSFVDKQTSAELLWQGDEKSWTGQDVVIFPFVGRLNNKSYTVDGKKYSLDIHGFVPTTKLDIVEARDQSVTLGCHFDERTLAQYPYKFNFLTTRSVDETATLTTQFVVENLDDKTIYFGLGGHPGLQLCGETNANGELETTGNFLDFGKKVSLRYVTLDDNGHFVTGEKDFGAIDELELSKALMRQYKCIILQGMPSQFTFVRKDGKKIKFDIGDAPFLGVWSDEKFGEYMCVEPWLTLPDTIKPHSELSQKPTILSLEKGKTYTYKYTMQVI